MINKRLVLFALLAVLLIAAMLPGVSVPSDSTAHTASAVIADTGDPTPTPTPTPEPQPNGGGCQGSSNCGD